MIFLWKELLWIFNIHYRHKIYAPVWVLVWGFWCSGLSIGNWLVEAIQLGYTLFKHTFWNLVFCPGVLAPRYKVELSRMCLPSFKPRHNIVIWNINTMASMTQKGKHVEHQSSCFLYAFVYVSFSGRKNENTSSSVWVCIWHRWTNYKIQTPKHSCEPGISDYSTGTRLKCLQAIEI